MTVTASDAAFLFDLFAGTAQIVSQWGRKAGCFFNVVLGWQGSR